MMEDTKVPPDLRRRPTLSPFLLVAAGAIAVAFFVVTPLFHLNVRLWRIHIMTGTHPYGWSQGLTSKRDSFSGQKQCCLVIGEWYWYVAPQ